VLLFHDQEHQKLKALYLSLQNFSLTNSNIKDLEKLLSQLKEFPSTKLSLTGYANSSGPEAYNMKLSKSRAQSVKKYLISKDVNADRLICNGNGEANPIASNKTKEGRAKNRRVEIENYDYKT
jgi:OmpA-OmpF porin, OOP family